MKPKTFLSALSAVALIGNVSCALFSKSSNESIAPNDAIILAEHNEKKEVESLPAMIPFAAEEETSIATQKFKSVLELEQPVSCAQNGKFAFVNLSHKFIFICTVSLETDDWPPRPILFNDKYLFIGTDESYEGIFTMLKFSPDGNKIAFSRIGKNEFGAAICTIYTMDQDGQNLKKIDDGYSPCFSPDGQRIVATDNFNQIFTCDLNGGDKSILVPKDIAARYPNTIRNINFTPDGNGIYFIQYNSITNSNDLMIADAVTGEIVKIFSGVSKASFSPDGKYIVFITSDCWNWEMRIMEVESGRIFEDLPAENFFDVIWSPDGHKIFCSKPEYCCLYDISFVDGRPVLEIIKKKSIHGADDFAWQSLPI